jgi:predicted nucleotidyltransferase
MRRGLNFTLTLDIGDLDLLGEITGGGTYEQMLPFSEEMRVYGVACRCVTLPKLIEIKRAAGRPKDFEAIAELEALLEEMQEGQEL